MYQASGRGMGDTIQFPYDTSGGSGSGGADSISFPWFTGGAFSGSCPAGYVSQGNNCVPQGGGVPVARSAGLDVSSLVVPGLILFGGLLLIKATR